MLRQVRVSGAGKLHFGMLMRPFVGSGPTALSAMRQIVRRDIARDTGFVCQEDPAPDHGISGHAVLTREARAVRQADDDFVAEPRAFTKLQKIIWSGAFDHCARPARAAGSDHEGEESS